YVLAIHHAEELIEKDKKDADLYALKGYALREVGQYDEAIEALKASLALRKGYAEAWNAMGMTYDLMRKPEEAEQAYLEALRINPTSPKYLNNIGFSLFGQGQYDRAAEFYQKALASDPLNAQIHNNLGFAYGMLGQYPEAIAEFKQAGRDEIVYNNLGFLYFMLGFNDEARVMYAKALDINPQYIKARRNLRLIDGDTNGRFPKPEHMGKLKP
ncbi:MAG: tetratricopeptide repeat protein, partial [Dehalococcoidia bacterium]